LSPERSILLILIALTAAEGQTLRSGKLTESWLRGRALSDWSFESEDTRGAELLLRVRVERSSGVLLEQVTLFKPLGKPAKVEYLRATRSFLDVAVENPDLPLTSLTDKTEPQRIVRPMPELKLQDVARSFFGALNRAVLAMTNVPEKQVWVLDGTRYFIEFRQPARQLRFTIQEEESDHLSVWAAAFMTQYAPGR
jgi:hypothetical protein